MATPFTSNAKQECEMKLNISIPDKVWEENPKFAHLLIDISTGKLGQYSARASTWSTHAKEDNKQNKQRGIHFQNKLLFDIIYPILFDKSVDDTPVALMASHALDLISLHHASVIEQPYIPKHYIATFIQDMDKREGLEMLRDSIVPDVEAKLTENAFKLLQLRDSSTDPDKPHLLVAKLKQLPSLIEQEIEQNEAYKRAKLVNDVNLQKNLEILIRKQHEYSQLIEVYSKENFEFVSAKESTEANLIVSKFQTMIEKLESVDKQVLVDTYTPENVQALDILNHKLIILKQNLVQEIHETKALLSSYGSMGPEFSRIVEEYSEFSREIAAARDVLAKQI